MKLSEELIKIARNIQSKVTKTNWVPVPVFLDLIRSKLSTVSVVRPFSSITVRPTSDAQLIERWTSRLERVVRRFPKAKVKMDFKQNPRRLVDSASDKLSLTNLTKQELYYLVTHELVTVITPEGEKYTCPELDGRLTKSTANWGRHSYQEELITLDQLAKICDLDKVVVDVKLYYRLEE